MFKKFFAVIAAIVVTIIILSLPATADDVDKLANQQARTAGKIAKSSQTLKDVADEVSEQAKAIGQLQQDFATLKTQPRQAGGGGQNTTGRRKVSPRPTYLSRKNVVEVNGPTIQSLKNKDGELENKYSSLAAENQALKNDLNALKEEVQKLQTAPVNTPDFVPRGEFNATVALLTASDLKQNERLDTVENQMSTLTTSLQKATSSLKTLADQLTAPKGEEREVSLPLAVDGWVRYQEKGKFSRSKLVEHAYADFKSGQTFQTLRLTPDLFEYKNLDEILKLLRARTFLSPPQAYEFVTGETNQGQ